MEISPFLLCVPLWSLESEMVPETLLANSDLFVKCGFCQQVGIATKINYLLL